MRTMQTTSKPLRLAIWGSFALMLIVLILFTIARLLGGGTPGELTKRQRRQLARQGARV